MMNSRAMGGIGGHPTIKITKREAKPNASSEDEIPHDHAIEIAHTPRHEESTEDIIDKMNKLHEEITEKHDKRKYERVDSKSARLVQVMAIGGIMIFAMVASFAMTCKNYGKKE
jgi:hypothetical protein